MGKGNKLNILSGVFFVSFLLSLLLQPDFVFGLLSSQDDKKYNKEQECKNTKIVTRIVHALVCAVVILLIAIFTDKLLVNDAILHTGKLVQRNSARYDRYG